MLQSAHILRFRSCHDVSLGGLAPVTALLGRNGAGKSNILRALDWAARHASAGPTPDVLFDDEGWNDGVRVEFQFTLEETQYRYAIARDFKWKPQPEFTWHEDLEILGSRARKSLLKRNGAIVEARSLAKAPLRIGSNTPALSAVLSLFSDVPESEPFSIVRGYLGRVRYYPLDEPERVPLPDRYGFIKEDDYKKWRAEVGTFTGSTPEAIRLVTLRDGQTVARQLTSDELSVARAFIVDEGQLSDFIESVEN